MSQLAFSSPNISIVIVNLLKTKIKLRQTTPTHLCIVNNTSYISLSESLLWQAIFMSVNRNTLPDPPRSPIEPFYATPYKMYHLLPKTAIWGSQTLLRLCSALHHTLPPLILMLIRYGLVLSVNILIFFICLLLTFLFLWKIVVDYIQNRFYATQHIVSM